MVNGPAVDEAPDVENECRHHWIIESAQGATSWGLCKRCAAKREFSNSCPGAVWEENHVSPDSLRSAPTYSLWWQRLPRLSLASVDDVERVGADVC